jgi:hypothetical protein
VNNAALFIVCQLEWSNACTARWPTAILVSLLTSVEIVLRDFNSMIKGSVSSVRLRIASFAKLKIFALFAKTATV